MAEKQDGTATKGKKMSMSERRKAEELLKARFRDLRTTINVAADKQKQALKTEFAKSRGVAKLEKQLEKAGRELRKLRSAHREKECKKATEVQELEHRISRLRGNFGSGYSDDVLETELNDTMLPLMTSLEEVNVASVAAHEALQEQERTSIEQLWLGALSADALAMIKAVPTVTALKENGLAILTTPARKLLAKG